MPYSSLCLFKASPTGPCPQWLPKKCVLREIILYKLEILFQIPVFEQLAFSILGGIQNKYGFLVHTILSCRI